DGDDGDGVDRDLVTADAGSETARVTALHAAVVVDRAVDEMEPADTADTAEPTAMADTVESAEESEASDDDDLLELRDAGTDEVERLLARRLKRELADEQNELLDALRR